MTLHGRILTGNSFPSLAELDGFLHVEQGEALLPSLHTTIFTTRLFFPFGQDAMHHTSLNRTTPFHVQDSKLKKKKKRRQAALFFCQPKQPSPLGLSSRKRASKQPNSSSVRRRKTQEAAYTPPLAPRCTVHKQPAHSSSFDQGQQPHPFYPCNTKLLITFFPSQLQPHFMEIRAASQNREQQPSFVEKMAS